MRPHIQAALWRSLHGQGRRFVVPAPPRASGERKPGAIAAARAKRARRTARNLGLLSAVAVSACSGGGPRVGEVARAVVGTSSTTSTSTTQPPAPPPTAAVTRSEPGGTVRASIPAPARSAPCDRPSTCPQLRQCENGGSYGHGTSPQFDGAYQFADKSKWGMTPADQDAAADKMYAERGAAPWPVCGRFLR